MILLELALQGVKGFPQSAKVALRPGYNVLLGATDKTPLARLLELLLFAGDEGQPSVELIASAGQPSRAGLTLLGKDGVTYRLVGDFASGGRALLKLDAATQKFTTLSERGSEVGQFLRGALGLPSRKMFTEMFSTTVASLPSRAGKSGQPAKPGAGSAKAPPDKPGFSGRKALDVEDLPTDPAVLRATLEKLRTELQQAREFVASQDKVSDLTQEIMRLESGLSALRKMEAEERDLAMELGKYAAAESLPAGVEERIKKMDQLQKRRDDAIVRIGREREQLQALLETAPDPFWKDARFTASALGGLALLAAGPFLGGLRALAVLDLVPFGYAAFLAYQWVGETESREGLRRKLDTMDERQKVVEREYDHSMALIKLAQDTLGVADPQLILHLLEQAHDARASFEAKHRQVEAAKSSAPFKEKLEGQTRAREESKVADALVLSQGYTRDPSEVERDIERYQTALEQMVGAHAGGPMGNVESLFDAKFVAGQDDRARDLLTLACDLFVSKPDEIGKAIAPRLAQYLAALTGRRFVTGAVDAQGILLLNDPQGRTVPFSALAPNERDEVWIALKFTLLERYLGRHKLPILFDDCFTSLDEARRGLAAKMLKYLGSLAQVVQCADSHAFASSADQAVRLQ